MRKDSLNVTIYPETIARSWSVCMRGRKKLEKTRASVGARGMKRALIGMKLVLIFKSVSVVRLSAMSLPEVLSSSGGMST